MSRTSSLQGLEARLFKLRDLLRGRIRSEMSETEGADDGILDVGESAMQAEHHEMNLQLIGFETAELDQVEHALVRLRAGKYGTCEGCGEEIPLNRLQALPFTDSCVSCQRTQESSAPVARDERSRWKSAPAETVDEPPAISGQSRARG